MRFIKPEDWLPSDGIKLEDNADKAVQYETNVLVIAGPGAGKTELLAQKADYLFKTNNCKDPRRILAISFKKDAAENLKKRVIKRCGKETENRFASMTYDAFSKSILDHFILALPAELQPQKDYLVNDDSVIDAAFVKSGYKNYDGLSKSRLQQHYDSVLASVSLPLGNNGYAANAWRLLLKGFDGYKPTLTFKMINILAEYIIKNNIRIRRAMQRTYSHVFLDEFQDTTSLQYNLVKSCFRNSNTRITAVGDSKQRIMLWAGALKTVFNDFQNDFNSCTMRLTMNHRSAPRLVMLQKQMYSVLNEKNIAISTSSRWEANDGQIKLFINDSEQEEASKVVNDIIKNINNGTAASEICILCKQTPEKYSQHIIEGLSGHGIRARIETKYQDLIKEPCVELIIRFLRLSVCRKNPGDWVYISELYYDLWGIDDSQDNNKYSIHQDMLIQKLNDICELMKQLKKRSEISNIIDNIIDLFGIEKIRSYYPAYKQGDYLNKEIEEFIETFWYELYAAKGNWILAIENFLGLHSIPIMTIHKSKGLEYSDVYFIGLEDGAFWNFKNQPEEDRCAFFVALSRAKKNLNFTFCKYRNKLRKREQKHNDINEFYELLQQPGVAEIL